MLCISNSASQERNFVDSAVVAGESTAKMENKLFLVTAFGENVKAKVVCGYGES